MAKQTNYRFVRDIQIAKKKAYEQASYFPFEVDHPYYWQNPDAVIVSPVLVLVDSILKVDIRKISLYLMKNNDTVWLNEEKVTDTYSGYIYDTFIYPGITNEPVITIRFNYDVLFKETSVSKNIQEEFMLYRVKHTFRSVH